MGAQGRVKEMKAIWASLAAGRCAIALSYNVDHSTISRLRIRHAAETL
jgi:hypothetical protein